MQIVKNAFKKYVFSIIITTTTTITTTITITITITTTTITNGLSDVNVDILVQSVARD
jgi:hypothetical protein